MACTRTSSGPSGGAGMSLGRLVAQGRPSGSHKLRDDAARQLMQWRHCRTEARWVSSPGCCRLVCVQGLH